MDVYSADFPGPMRDVVRAVTGGECIFFQGAAGNVLPKFAFTDTEEEAHRMGTRLGLAALEAVADRYSRDVDVVAEEDGSVTPITRYRRRFAETDEAPALAAASETVSIPLMPHPPLEEVEQLRRRVRRGARGGARLGEPRGRQDRLLPRVLGAPGRGAAARRHGADRGARAGARGADR